MQTNRSYLSTAKGIAGAAGILAASYGVYAGVAWARYGTPKRVDAGKSDSLLDHFMPDFEVVERHNVQIAAPAEATLTAAKNMDLGSCGLTRAIFKGRELLLGSEPDRTVRPRELYAAVKSFGWGVLAEVPGREVVFGGVTKPWEPNPTFRALAPDEFAKFQEPGYVKIAWTLRADPLEDGTSMFRTETRAAATDLESRRRFRIYWAFLSPGIIAIRYMMLAALRKSTLHPRKVESAA